jgi:uncharacterized protein (DUF433 family)
MGAVGSTAYTGLRRRPLSETLIVSDPAVLLGKPVVAGTRITGEWILEKPGNGESIDQSLDSHPRPSCAAALRCAAPALRVEMASPVGG